MSRRVSVGKRTNPAEYCVWSNMKNRCTNKNSGDYKYYGGRGIYFCRRWRLFKNFYKDMGSRPGPEYQIDRIDNNGPYAPWNCKWVTRTTNMRNTRKNKLITYKGMTKTLVEWAEITGIPYRALQQRLNIGWGTEDTLSLQIGQKTAKRKRIKKERRIMKNKYPDVKGVTYRKDRDVWVTRIPVDGKMEYIGYSDVFYKAVLIRYRAELSLLYYRKREFSTAYLYLKENNLL